MRVLELLAGAGYRPTKYSIEEVQQVLPDLSRYNEPGMSRWVDRAVAGNMFVVAGRALHLIQNIQAGLAIELRCLPGILI